MWNNSALYSYTPPSNPSLTIYYVGIGSREQRRLLADFSSTFDSYIFLEDVFASCVVLIEEQLDNGVMAYNWPPHDKEEQEHLLTHLDEIAVMETAAHLLGGLLDIDEHGYAHFLAPNTEGVVVSA